MPQDKIKNKIHQAVGELFATAAVDELTGDTEAYRIKLEKIAAIAELPGIETEITTITLNLKPEGAQMESGTISSLTWEAQSLLRTMSNIYINKGLSIFFLKRSKRAESLVENGICVERFDNYTTYADYHSKDMVIDALQNASIYKVCPPRNTKKRELNAIVENLEKNRLGDLRQGIILLDFHEDPEMIKHEFRGSRDTRENKQRRLDFLLEKGINPDELCNYVPL